MSNSIKSIMLAILLILPFCGINSYAKSRYSLEEITKFANDYCLSPEKGGSHITVTSKGGGLARIKFLGGINGEVDVEYEEWDGLQKVLQNEQLQENVSYRKCKEKLTPIVVKLLLIDEEKKTEELKISIGDGASTRIKVVSGRSQRFGLVRKIGQWHRIKIFNPSNKAISITHIGISSKNNNIPNHLIIQPTLIYDEFYRSKYDNYLKYPIYIRSGEVISGHILIPLDLNPKYKSEILNIIEAGSFGFNEVASEHLIEQTKNIPIDIQYSITDKYIISFSTGSGKTFHVFLKSGKHSLDQLVQITKSNEIIPQNETLSIKNVPDELNKNSTSSTTGELRIKRAWRDAEAKQQMRNYNDRNSYRTQFTNPYGGNSRPFIP